MCAGGVAGVSNPLAWCKLPRARARRCTLPGRGVKKPRQGLSVFLGGVLLADLTPASPSYLPLLPRAVCQPLLHFSVLLAGVGESGGGPLTIKSSSLITSEPPGHHPVNEVGIFPLYLCVYLTTGGG